MEHLPINPQIFASIGFISAYFAVLAYTGAERVEALFCLIFLFLFASRQKERRKFAILVLVFFESANAPPLPLLRSPRAVKNQRIIVNFTYEMRARGSQWSGCRGALNFTLFALSLSK